MATIRASLTMPRGSTPAPSDQTAAAFAAGCDARLAGKPLAANPHRPKTGVLGSAWRDGWLEAQRNYGKHVAGRWCVAPLPEVG